MSDIFIIIIFLLINMPIYQLCSQDPSLPTQFNETCDYSWLMMFSWNTALVYYRSFYQINLLLMFFFLKWWYMLPRGWTLTPAQLCLSIRARSQLAFVFSLVCSLCTSKYTPSLRSRTLSPLPFFCMMLSFRVLCLGDLLIATFC